MVTGVVALLDRAGQYGYVRVGARDVLFRASGAEDWAGMWVGQTVCVVLAPGLRDVASHVRPE